MVSKRSGRRDMQFFSNVRERRPGISPEGDTRFQSPGADLGTAVAGNKDPLDAGFAGTGAYRIEQLVGFADEVFATRPSRRIPDNHEDVVPFERPRRRRRAESACQPGDENVEDQPEAEPLER